MSRNGFRGGEIHWTALANPETRHVVLSFCCHCWVFPQNNNDDDDDDRKMLDSNGTNPNCAVRGRSAEKAVGRLLHVTDLQGFGAGHRPHAVPVKTSKRRLPTPKECLIFLPSEREGE